jgi:hypothetical protein
MMLHLLQIAISYSIVRQQALTLQEADNAQSIALFGLRLERE